jgi:hypothetical protein
MVPEESMVSLQTRHLRCACVSLIFTCLLTTKNSPRSDKNVDVTDNDLQELVHQRVVMYICALSKPIRPTKPYIMR